MITINTSIRNFVVVYLLATVRFVWGIGSRFGGRGGEIFLARPYLSRGPTPSPMQ